MKKQKWEQLRVRWKSIIKEKLEPMSPYVKHFPVMSEEVINYISKDPNGTYIDCTFGAGGHSKKLLESLGPNAKVIGIDLDDDAVSIGRELEKQDSRFRIVKLNFADLPDYLRKAGIQKVDGIIFDLGVSTMQLSSPDRGFSFRFADTNLDMRMNKKGEKTAADILNSYTKHELSRIFKKYGDIKNPSKLVNLISEYRKQNDDISTVADFNDVIFAAFGEQEFFKYLQKCYQALRIEVNNELHSLERALDSLQDVVAKNGIVCIITFHSLEINVVKSWKQRNCDAIQIHDYIENISNQFRSVVEGYLIPTKEEVSENWPSRSAKLWVIQKVR